MSVGFNRTGIYDVGYQRAMVNVCGTIIVNGPVSIGAGSRIEVAKNATLVFNGKVSNCAGVTIECQDQISIGDNMVISWNTTIIDCDFHYVKKNSTGKTKPMHKPIVIGENCWLCAGSIILKGSVLSDGSILSAGSVLNKRIDENECLLTGNPAVIVRRNITRSDISMD